MKEFETGERQISSQWVDALTDLPQKASDDLPQRNDEEKQLFPRFGETL
jgi:hypothetical protein